MGEGNGSGMMTIKLLCSAYILQGLAKKIPLKECDITLDSSLSALDLMFCRLISPFCILL